MKTRITIVLAFGVLLAAVAALSASPFPTHTAAGTSDIDVNLNTVVGTGATARNIYVHAVTANVTVSLWNDDSRVEPIYGDSVFTVIGGTDMMLTNTREFDLVFINRTSSTEAYCEVW